MSNRDKTLLTITILLVALFIAGIVYDRNDSLLKRTAPQMFYEDENLELVSMDKYGMMFHRVAYTARFKVVDGYWEPYFVDLANQMQTKGDFFTIDEYKEYKTKVLTNQQVIPNPTNDAIIWIGGAGDDKEGIVCIVDQEADGNAYIYVYYSR